MAYDLSKVTGFPPPTKAFKGRLFAGMTVLFRPSMSKCPADQDFASAANNPRAALKRSAGSGSGSLIRSLSGPSIA